MTHLETRDLEERLNCLDLALSGLRLAAENCRRGGETYLGWQVRQLIEQTEHAARRIYEDIKAGERDRAIESARSASMPPLHTP